MGGGSETPKEKKNTFADGKGNVKAPTSCSCDIKVIIVWVLVM